MPRVADMLTASKLADRLGITEREVKARYRRGEIPGIRITQGTVRFDLVRVTQAIQDAEAASRSQPLTLDVVAWRLGLRLDVVHTLAEARILPVVGRKGHLRVQIQDLEAWSTYAKSPFRDWRPRGDAIGAREDGFVYFLEAIGSQLVKIGESHSPNRHGRIGALDQTSPLPLRLLAVKPGGQREEAILHHRFAVGRMRWEWFDIRTPGLRAEIAECRRTFGRPRGLRLPAKFEALLDAAEIPADCVPDALAPEAPEAQ